MIRLIFVIAVVSMFAATLASAGADSLRHPEEKHLRNIRQLTFVGIDAAVSFSYEDKQLIFQSTRPPFSCDQIYTMTVDGSHQQLVSTGKGRAICASFFPGNQRILFASTHAHGNECPQLPNESNGYIWPVPNTYDIYTADANGSHLKVLTAADGYDAEATISPNGRKIVFTSSRDGDIDIYTMNLNGTDIRRITVELGFDGGASFSWDGRMIVYCAYHPKDSTEVAEYKALLAVQLVRPKKMGIFICDAEGKNRRELTAEGAVNLAPFFHPKNARIIFSSNMKDSTGRSFELFMLNADGSGLEQITFGSHFNSSPKFSRDGKKLVFISNRNSQNSGECNAYIADWID